jgi:menaquinone-dependent protoporphyrinogen oxidase
MAHVLILYGTTDGHTHKVAQAIADGLSRVSVDTSIVKVGACEPVLSDYDAVVVAGSVHGGRYQRPVAQWVKAHVREFGSRPTAFISVSLGVLQKGDAKVAADLDAIVKRFCDDTGWRPDVIKHVAGALLYTQYNVLKRWIMKRIVAKAGGDTDTSRDYEYTDWNDVRAFAEDFGRRLARAA